MDWRRQTEVGMFVLAAQAFCRVVEVQSSELDVWAKGMLQSTIALYSAGLALTQLVVASGREESDEAAGVSTEQWKELYDRLGTFLGGKRWYVTAGVEAELADASQGSLYGDLADDLADIYRDIQPGLQRWETEGDEYLGDIVWEWRFLFIAHWGHHAIAASEYLHRFVF
ncbi:MAG: DUF5063 domain-containing protein [Ktedonobacteraceae bacterium]|nr:DUF5063 domain-containing protein [Ktedonobacteraceae bacterium]